MINTIKNNKNKNNVVVSVTKGNLAVIKFLADKGFISHFEFVNKRNAIIYTNTNSKIQSIFSDLIIVSKPERSIRLKKEKVSSTNLLSSYYRNHCKIMNRDDLSFQFR